MPGRSKFLIGAVISLLLMLVGLGAAGHCLRSLVTGAVSLAFQVLPALVASAVVQEPAEVAALVTEIAPGAMMPEGYVGFGFASEQSPIAFLAPPGCWREQDELQADSLVIVIGRQPADAAGGDSVLGFSQGDELGEPEALEPEAIRVGGQDVVFQKRRVRRRAKDSGRPTAVLEYLGSWPARGQRAVRVLIMGPEATFDRKTMDAFLGGIEPAGK
jgi:hypothetical protein